MLLLEEKRRGILFFFLLGEEETLSCVRVSHLVGCPIPWYVAKTTREREREQPLSIFYVEDPEVEREPQVACVQVPGLENNKK